MWYFLSAIVPAIGRMLIRAERAVPVDPGQHVRRSRDLVVDDAPRVLHARRDPLDQLLRTRVDDDHGVAAAALGPDLGLDHEPRRRVDPVLLPGPSCPQLDRREPDLERID